ncbi:MAG: hypothetical protein KKD64_02795 [Alphaproteobacteria bacterium]|nr:hypothetical protein [Alphaproteobacteria bacterium]MBU0793816.1 hypothetical protein [Alphaproteobacteria bacterium]MBU0874390.1 hypothetical protein [Alphaproteobacteria bacterium]MBU1768565.1 hypothetical protein [Alphaproteobacteria bacterium]
MYRPRPLAAEISALSERVPTPVRVIVGLWIVAGAIYALVNPSLDVVPAPLALAVVSPLLLAVATLMIFNLYRLIFWIAHLGHKN